MIGGFEIRKNSMLRNDHMDVDSGFTVWLTGLPCSGKTTLARMLEAELTDVGRAVVVLDGDEVRQRLSRGLGFSKEDRDENVLRIAYVARLITQVGGVAIVCAISPYRAIRNEVRREIVKFVEVYISCPVEVCRKRDVKGLYQKALRGQITNFTGVSDPYEKPQFPEVLVYTDRQSPVESLETILLGLERIGYLTAEKRVT